MLPDGNSVYPGAYDTFTRLVELDKRHAIVHKEYETALEAIQAELGISPAGGFDTLADRLATAADVTSFGAVGDGTTDDTAAIQSAIDTLMNGDELVFPQGIYKITSALDFGAIRGLRIRGIGGQSANEGTYVGAVIRCDTDAQVGFDFNNAGSLIHEGPIVENLNFVDNSTSGDAILARVEDMNYWTFRNCTFRVKDPSSSSDGGTGLQLVRSAGQDNAWGMIDQCRFIGLDVGIDGQGALGFVMTGGNFIIHTGQTGVVLDDDCQSSKFVAVKFDGPGRGIHLNGAQFTQMIGCSFEDCSTGVDIDDPNAGSGRGVQNAIIGGVMTGASSTGVSIASGVWGTVVFAVSFNNMSVGVDSYARDSVLMGYGGKLPVFRPDQVFADSTRPAASGVAAGGYVYNTDDNAPNWSDGTNWRDAAGNVT